MNGTPNAILEAIVRTNTGRPQPRGDPADIVFTIYDIGGQAHVTYSGRDSTHYEVETNAEAKPENSELRFYSKTRGSYNRATGTVVIKTSEQEAKPLRESIRRGLKELLAAETPKEIRFKDGMDKPKLWSEYIK